MTIIIDQILNGISLGALYAPIAAGVAVIFGVVELVNFAHGEFYMVGAYIFFGFSAGLHLPYVLVLVLTVGCMGILGGLLELTVIRPIVHRPWQTQLVATLGISILLANLFAVEFGTFPRRVFTSLSNSTFNLGSIEMSYQRLVLILGTIGAFVVLDVFIKRSRIGKAMRATSQNRDACVNVGINVQVVAIVTFALAAGLAGLAAALYVPLTPITPTMGQLLIIKAFVVVIMGGFGRIDATIISAFLLGELESFIIQYVSSAYVDVFSFVLMVAVLLFRPYGLFGRRVGI